MAITPQSRLILINNTRLTDYKNQMDFKNASEQSLYFLSKKSFISWSVISPFFSFSTSSKNFSDTFRLSTLIIPKNSLAGGRWNVNMEWQYDGKLYLSKEIIYIQ